jgi:hypothetical protein
MSKNKLPYQITMSDYDTGFCEISSNEIYLGYKKTFNVNTVIENSKNLILRNLPILENFRIDQTVIGVTLQKS